MPKQKSLHIVVDYVNTPYVTNDLGKDKSPRFELLDEKTIQVVAKSNNPIDFDDVVYGRDKNAEPSEEPKKRRGRPRKSAE